jgi:molecular chaperone GrpE (heat shock protein)
LAKRGAQLYELAQEEYAESAEALAGALEEAGLRLFRLAGVPWASLLLRVFQSESEKSRSALTSENERLKRESADLSDKFQEALTEAGRLRDLAEMLKSSASVDKQELEAQIRIEAYRPVLLLVDDLERQATANSDLTIRHLISMLASALEHAGVRRVGTPGDVCGFDRDFHEFVEAPPQLEGTPDVRVLRSGFVLDTARGPRIIRRAAVRMP